jgi:2,4-dienoyl-CoA reductase-like NADH-dependent reductase (Old Yellow Enzyme family)
VPSLFDPYQLRGLTIRNRIWVPPMCQFAVTARDGVPTDWHLVNLGSLARGGAGLILAEASGVVPEGRISPHDCGIWNDEQVGAWRRITRFVQDEGAVIGLQLAHAGRKASDWPQWGFPKSGCTMPADEGGWPTVSSSAVAFPGHDVPRALATDEIPGVVAAFRDAAGRSLEAGFDFVEIHAAHGYLVHQFLSPLANFRTDDYGGSLENRARLLLEIVAAVRAEIGDAVPLMVRMSATDWIDGGWDLESTTAVARWAHSAGADFFDISSGGLLPAQVPVGPGYQVPLATHVAGHAGVPVSAVGLITTPRQAADIVASGAADAVMIGREMMRDPHFALRTAAELGVELDYWPRPYLRARTRP